MMITALQRGATKEGTYANASCKFLLVERSFGNVGESSGTRKREE